MDPLVAIAARAWPGDASATAALLAEAGPLLGAVLERRELLEARRRHSEVIVATERRIARLGLDLHDGPLQEAAALLSDLRLFRDQLGAALGAGSRDLLIGRIQDLEARAAALEAGLRELARTAGGPAALEGSIAELLREEARSFARASGITPWLELSGPVDEATASQRITLVRAVQEALRNVARHAAARSVSIEVAATPGTLEASVVDDGGGFDVARAIARARRDGRIGLAGIDERARLLGGSCTIRSRRGGPTVVTVRLPRWRPA